jgi:hypothetical protein
MPLIYEVRTRTKHPQDSKTYTEQTTTTGSADGALIIRIPRTYGSLVLKLESPGRIVLHREDGDGNLLSSPKIRFTHRGRKTTITV